MIRAGPKKTIRGQCGFTQKQAAPEFFSRAAVVILSELLWPWWRCGLFRSRLRLSLDMLRSSGHSRSRRPAVLIKARTWLSRAMRFARRSARRRRRDRTTQPRWCPRFPAATLSWPHVTWCRSAEALTFKCLAATLRRNIFRTTRRTRTLAQPACRWPALFWRGWRRERRPRAWSASAAFKWRRRYTCGRSRRRACQTGLRSCTWFRSPPFKR